VISSTTPAVTPAARLGPDVGNATSSLDAAATRRAAAGEDAPNSGDDDTLDDDDDEEEEEEVREKYDGNRSTARCRGAAMRGSATRRTVGV
jgi:hypothetical protein